MMKRIAKSACWIVWLFLALSLIVTLFAARDRIVDQIPRWISTVLVVVVAIILRFDSGKSSRPIVLAVCVLLAIPVVWVSVPPRGWQNLYAEAQSTRSELTALDTSTNEVEKLVNFTEDRNFRRQRFAVFPELSWLYSNRSRLSEEAFLDRAIGQLGRSYREGINVTKIVELATRVKALSPLVTESQLSELHKLLREALVQCELTIASQIGSVDPTDVETYEEVRAEWEPLAPIARRVTFIPQKIHAQASNWKTSSEQVIVEKLRTLQTLNTKEFSTLRKQMLAVENAVGGGGEPSNKIELAEKEWLDRSLMELKEQYPLQHSISASSCRLLHSQSSDLLTTFFPLSRSSSLLNDLETDARLLDLGEYKENIVSMSDYLKQHITGVISRDLTTVELLEEFLETHALYSQLDKSRWSHSYRRLGWDPIDPELIDAVRQRSVNLLLATWEQGIEKARNEVAEGRYADAAQMLDELMESVQEESNDLHRYQWGKQVVMQMLEEKRGQTVFEHAEVLTVRAAASKFFTVKKSIDFLAEVGRRRVLPKPVERHESPSVP